MKDGAYYQDVAGNSIATWMNGVSTDHTSQITGETNGGALFINVDYYFSGVVYETWVANLSNGLSDPIVSLKFFDEDGNEIEGGKSDYVVGANQGWLPLKGDFTLPGTGVHDVTLRLYSSCGTRCNDYDYWSKGNDLIIDDIKFMVCSPPSLEAYSDITTFAKDSTICSDVDFTIEAPVSTLLENFFGGNQKFLFQYSGDLGKTWKNVSGLETHNEYTINTGDYADDEMQFRVVVATADVLSEFLTDPNKADFEDICRNYSVTEPFTITRAGNVNLGAEYKGSECMDIEVTFVGVSSTELVAWNWQDAKGTNLTPVSSELENKDYAFKLTSDTTLYFLGYTSDGCVGKRKYSMSVNPTASIEISLDTLCGKSEITTTATPTNATITASLDGASFDLSLGKQIIDDEEMVGELIAYAEASGYCKSVPDTVVIVYKSVPSETLAAIPAFCEYVKGEKSKSADATDAPDLPVSANAGVDVAWYEDETKLKPAETDLTALSGKEEPYTYYYTLTQDGCTSDPAKYDFTVKPLAKIELMQTNECDKTTLGATTTPATATVLWSNNETGDVEITTAAGAGKYTATASADGYCASESADIDAEFYATPGKLVADKVSLLKSEAPFSTDELLAAVNASTQTAGAKTLWIGPNTTSATPAATDGASETPTAPSVTHPENTDDEFQYYYVFQRSEHTKSLTCDGEMTEIVVSILGAPAPETKDAELCQGGESVDLDTLASKSVNSDPIKNYELLWYRSIEQTTPETEAPTVSTASAGVTTYYVSQREVGTKNESSKMPVKITVYGVPMPKAEAAVEYCVNDAAVALKADYSDGVSEYVKANALKWYEGSVTADGGSTTAPTPSTAAAVKDKKYNVSATYTLVDGKVCEGDAAEITVNVYESSPATAATISYIKAEAVNNEFPALTTRGNWNEESGFDYYYSAVSATDAKPAGPTAYAKDAPKPTYDVSTLSGGSATLYCWVYRVDKGNNKECASEPVLLTIRINDALPPTVKNVYVCEGSVVPVLEAEVQLLPGSGKTASDYEIRWYGESDPGADAGATVKGTGGTYDPKVLEAKATAAAKTETRYYVTQYDLTTNAESSPAEVVVTVLPKPVIEIKQPAAVCEKAVDMKDTWSVTNATNDPFWSTLTVSYRDSKQQEVSDGIAKESDLYSVKPSYTVTYAGADIVVADEKCEGADKNVNVQIDTLSVPEIEGTHNVCPLESGVQLTAKDRTSEGLTFKWSGSQEGEGGALNLETFPDETGREYTYVLEATRGTCKKSSAEHVITVGEGRVDGVMTVTEAGNDDLPATFGGNAEKPEVYACGGEVKLTVNYAKNSESDYTWYKNDIEVATGESYTIEKTDKTSNDAYEVRFVNKCDAKAKIIVHNIPLTASAESGDTVLCEGEAFTQSLNYECDETPTVKWMLDGEEIAGATNSVYTKNGVKESEDEGKYAYEVSNRGCKVSGDGKTLDVKRNIEAEQLPDYIVTRGEKAEMSLAIKVPEDKNVGTAKWTDETGAVAEARSTTYTVESVELNHTYTVELSDDNYCGATTTVVLKADAKLQLTTSLGDTLCHGLSDVLEIDTTGTGAFYRGDAPKLTVTRTMGGESADVSGELVRNGDKLNLSVSPETDATYQIMFTYDKQEVETTEKVVVIPAIDLTVPPVLTICEGDDVDLTVTDVTPSGTTVTWKADATINGTTEGETVNVSPTYTGGTNHQSTYTYTAVAYNAQCRNSKEYEVSVRVDEPLRGELSGTEAMCEGEQGRVDAGAYAADTYSWSAGGEAVGTGSAISVAPEETTTYTVEMSRGTCTASDSHELRVTTIPVITSVDSIGVRDRQIVTEAGKGTGVFYYWVDVEASIATEPIVYNLTFSRHTAYVRDEIGCQSSYEFFIKAPDIDIPEFFTPDGNGINDGWVVKTLAEVYPDAKIWIYDRFGKLMAEMLGSDADGWDGTYNGKPLPSTDYWYVIDIEEIDTQYTGHFTLIRQ